MILKENTKYSKSNIYHTQPTVKLHRHADNWEINQCNRNTLIKERNDKISRQKLLNAIINMFKLLKESKIKIPTGCL